VPYRVRGIVTLILQATVVGLAAAFVAVLVRPELLPAPSPAPIDFSPGVAAAAPAVVSIYTARERPGRGGAPGEGLGSGVILSGDGVIATNSHVVSGADDVRVRLADGRSGAASSLGALNEPSELTWSKRTLTRLLTPLSCWVTP